LQKTLIINIFNISICSKYINHYLNFLFEITGGKTVLE
jgi:hypothetical protein